MPIDLTNSDDEASVQKVQQAHRRQSSSRKGIGKSPLKSQDIVDLTSDTPPKRRRSRGVGTSKMLELDEDGGENLTEVVGAGGSAARTQIKRRKISYVSDSGEGCSRSPACQDLDQGCCSSNGAKKKEAGRKGESPSEAQQEQRDSGELECLEFCPMCSVGVKPCQRVFLSCNHWACSECLAKLALDTGRCYSCHLRITVSDMRQFLTEDQVRCYPFPTFSFFWLYFAHTHQFSRVWFARFSEVTFADKDFGTSGSTNI